ncbi:MAG: hypothetical protein Q9186_005968 [Xanthomendoza sp. 1 TL-2023]
MTSPSHQPSTMMTSEQACPSCGADITNLLEKLAQSTQSRISELEAQVRILTDKATAAVDKLADYEDQLHQLKSSSQKPHPQSTDHLSSNEHHHSFSSSTDTIPQRSPFQSRLSSLLPSSRRSTSQPPSSAPATQLTHSQSVRQPLSSSSSSSHHQQPTPHHHHHHHHHQHTSSNPLPTTTDLHALQTQLDHERTLRLAAESSLHTTNTELEDLSASLFREANELVAVERRSSHQLKLRCEELAVQAEVLEKKVGEREKEEGRLRDRVRVLEGREGEKGRRWEELERMVGRVERVRGLLGKEMGGEKGEVGRERGEVGGEKDGDGREKDRDGMAG